MDYFEYKASPIKLGGGVLFSLTTSTRKLPPSSSHPTAPTTWATSFVLNLGTMGALTPQDSMGLNWDVYSSNDPAPKGSLNVNNPMLEVASNRFRVSLDPELDKQVNNLFTDTFKKTAEKYQSMSPDERKKALDNITAVVNHYNTPGGKVYPAIKGPDIESMLMDSPHLNTGHTDTLEKLRDGMPLGSSEITKGIDKDMKDVSEKAFLRLSMWTHASIALLDSQILTQPVLDVMKRVTNVKDRYPEAISTFIRSKKVGSDDHKHFVKEYWNQIGCK